MDSKLMETKCKGSYYKNKKTSLDIFLNNNLLY